MLELQSGEIQDFLLETSLLEQLCSPLCNAVTGGEDSQSTLTWLEQANLFLIRLDEERRWYRYHHLFRDLLRTSLVKTYPGRVNELHRRASAWYASENHFEEAIAHAMSGKDFECAANLVERAVEHLDMQNKQVVLTRWVDSLPRETLETRPWLCVYRALGYYWTGRRELVEEWLRAAENSIETGPKQGDPEKDHILGHIAAVRAHAALTGEDITRVLEMGQKTLALLPEGDEMRCETAVALWAAPIGLWGMWSNRSRLFDWLRYPL